jgi:hypothetical protein
MEATEAVKDTAKKSKDHCYNFGNISAEKNWINNLYFVLKIQLFFAKDVS